jgi:DNA replicative helicase MCM subunit Mcm2 (Cdc46/Mcm family)
MYADTSVRSRKNGGQLLAQPKSSKFVKYQEIRIQETVRDS